MPRSQPQSWLVDVVKDGVGGEGGESANRLAVLSAAEDQSSLAFGARMNKTQQTPDVFLTLAARPRHRPSCFFFVFF